MNLLEVAVKVLALAILAAFLGIIIWKVREPDLIILSVLVWIASAYDNLFRPIVARRFGK